jgi:hypothetical protein
LTANAAVWPRSVDFGADSVGAGRAAADCAETNANNAARSTHAAMPIVARRNPPEAASSSPAALR